MQQHPVSDAAPVAMRWLAKLCAAAPQYPAVALWRCWEMALLSSLELPPPLLDLGCGDGHIVQGLLGNTPTAEGVVVGLDVDEASAAQAAREPVYTGVVAGDARRLPWASAAFASVVSVCVLEHVQDVRPALAEAARVLAPGGVLALTVPTDRLSLIAADSRTEGGEQYARSMDERLAHHNAWGLATWQSALEAAGLSPCTATGFMGDAAALAWLAAYDWSVRPVRGRGLLYRAAGPGLRRLGIGHSLAWYWTRRLRRWAAEGVQAPLQQAGAMMLVARKPESP